MQQKQAQQGLLRLGDSGRVMYREHSGSNRIIEIEIRSPRQREQEEESLLCRIFYFCFIPRTRACDLSPDVYTVGIPS